MILLIDNYDSFVHNLARHFVRLGQETVVVRNDKIDSTSLEELNPSAIVLSPGPCTPTEAGNSLQIVREWHTRVPMLGVCLGHQVIASALGGKITRARQVMHGRTSMISHDGKKLFSSLPDPLTVCRYHSLVVEPDSLPDELRATAWTDDGTVMAFEHAKQPVFGVQFHPEAILTEHGFELLANFLEAAGISLRVDPKELKTNELSMLEETPKPLPTGPVTF